MNKLQYLLLCTLLLLQTSCNGCQPHDATRGQHEQGCTLTLESVESAGTINGYPVYHINGKIENDYTEPQKTIIGAIFDPTTASDGEKPAIKAIADKEPHVPQTDAEGKQEAVVQPNEIVKLDQGIVINYEGPKERVIEDNGKLAFIASFVNKDALQPNTKYLVDLFAAEPRISSGAHYSVYMSKESLTCTTPDFSENASRKVNVTKAERSTTASELTFHCKADGTDMPASGVAFFLLVKKCGEDLAQDVFKAIERLILNDHKLSDGTELETLKSQPPARARFVLIDPAQPTEGAIYPLGPTTGGDQEIVAENVPMVDVDKVIPKDGGKYWATVVVYEPEGIYTVSTNDYTVEVPGASADLALTVAEIKELIVDVSGEEAAVNSFELEVKGSMKNPKALVKPRPYFVFHKSLTATATEQQLKGVVNSTAKATVGGWGTNGDYIVYPVVGSISGNSDETIDKTNEDALKVTGSLELGQTYQVYLAIKDNEGNGGTTIVSDTPVKLEIPTVDIELQALDKGEKQFSRQLQKHVITTRAQINNMVFFDEAKMGVLFVEETDKFSAADMRGISDDWKKTQKLEKEGERPDIPKNAFLYSSTIKKAYKRHPQKPNSGINTVIAEISAKDLYRDDSDGCGPLKKETNYFPYLWIWKGNSIFYASDGTKFFRTSEFLSNSGHYVMDYDNNKYYYSPQLKKIFLLQGDDLRALSKNDPTIDKILKANLDKGIDVIKRNLE